MKFEAAKYALQKNNKPCYIILFASFFSLTHSSFVHHLKNPLQQHTVNNNAENHIDNSTQQQNTNDDAAIYGEV